MYMPTDGHIHPAASGLMLGSTSAAKARVRYASAVPSESSSQSRSSTRRSLSPRASSIKLPSIQAMLSSAGVAAANMHASSPHSPSSSRSARSRSHTSPMSMSTHQDSASAGPNLPPIHNLAHTAQALTVGGAPIHPTAQAADYRAARGRVQLLEIPLAGDLNVRDMKFGIDMLATAAVSVSSGRANMSLPHLTPLAGLFIPHPAGILAHQCAFAVACHAVWRASGL
ncbi:hypothetical protein DL89DRAFT_37453 [Linderina pennispora]|uniref:Uncharacterized protein n=1 Tax=Linderina pennispora TaxID=61395 RepID=A0A1Y1W320_9FUNG|nr:uncharacterized protein DL89DRAFT_37453 [Linderina pennispora]ORX67857.1 hypothetical protein DL89DRAFT_37453 [Linderina pennispora]